MSAIDKYGKKYTLGELFKRQEAGRTLPALKVFDPDTDSWTTQVPDKIIKHPFNPEKPMLKIRTTDESTPIEVTGNHYLWARRDEKEFWIRAENLVEGDILRTGNNTWDTVAKIEGEILEQTSHSKTSYDNVYNISFGGSKVHNYAISSDGDQWLVAHNWVK